MSDVVWQGELDGTKVRVRKPDEHDLIVEESLAGEWGASDDGVAMRVLVKALLEADVVIRAVQTYGRLGKSGDAVLYAERSWRQNQT